MIKTHFKTACRHLVKNKVFTAINIIGLAISMVVFFFVVQYVSFEMSYDQFHANKENLYRVGLNRYVDGELKEASSKNFSGIRTLLEEHFPEVESTTGFYKTPANTGFLFRYNGKIYNEPGGVLNSDSAFFDVFPTLLKRGNSQSALKSPHNLILSESTARKIFGEKDPIGETVQRIDDYDQGRDFVVTGVMKDIPQNAHFHANFIRHIDDSWPDQEPWKDSFLHIYITLRPGTDPGSVSNKINVLLKKLEPQNPGVRNTKVFLTPITEIHLSSNLKDEVEANGSNTLVYMASFIGLIILIIAWINYINLETARFISRAREVGVRRIIGSRKSDLALQFLVEYLCMLTGAVILSAFMVLLLLPYFSTLTGIPVSEISWPQIEVWTVCLVVLVSGSFFAGIYPAIFLLRLNPVSISKDKVTGQKYGSLLRRSLVVVQFGASLILIGFVFVIHRQLEFMRSADKKFDVDYVIAIRNPTAYSGEEVIEKHASYRTLENKLMENTSVKMVTSSSAIPGTEIGFTYVNLLKRNVNDPYDPTPYKTLFIDYNYIPFFGLNLLAGRNFDPPRPISNWQNPWEDESWLTLILNESAIRALGFSTPEEAIDQIVEFENFEDNFQKHKIIGVIADYHHEAVKKEVFPMILSPNYGSFQQVYYSIRLPSGTNLPHAVNTIAKSWQETFPEKPFEYFFLDEYYDQQFKSEVHFQNIFALLAAVAIFIASLGILGMTLFEAHTRIKEISIRKVLGASVLSLLALLSRDHIKVICISLIISFPLIWFIASEWLSSYPSRIEITAEFFFFPLLIIIVMVALTSSFQTWKTTRSNPVDHLRNE